MRPIDADALIDEFEWCKQQAAECNRKEWDEIITRVSKQPTVDAVPVKWIETYMDSIGANGLLFNAMIIEKLLRDYKKRADGERKDGERKDDGTTLD